MPGRRGHVLGTTTSFDLRETRARHCQGGTGALDLLRPPAGLQLGETGLGDAEGCLGGGNLLTAPTGLQLG